jgi:hypothetical protein
MNVICVNCKEIYVSRPDQCPDCGGKTFEQTMASVPHIKYNTLAEISIAFDNHKLSKDELINWAFSLGMDHANKMISSNTKESRF